MSFFLVIFPLFFNHQSSLFPSRLLPPKQRSQFLVQPHKPFTCFCLFRIGKERGKLYAPGNYWWGLAFPSQAEATGKVWAGGKGKFARKHSITEMLDSFGDLITLDLGECIQKSRQSSLQANYLFFIVLNGISSLLRKSNRWSRKLSGHTELCSFQTNKVLCVGTIGGISNWS